MGIPAGYLAAHYGLGADPSSMPYALACAIVVGGFEAFGRSGKVQIDRTLATGIAWALRAAAVPAITYLIAAFMFETDWTGMKAVLWPGLFTVLAVGAIGSLDAIAKRRPGATIPIVLMLLGTGGALVLALSGTARVGESFGAVTATAGATLIVALWDGRVALSRGGVAAFVLTCLGLVIFGYTGLFGAEQRIAGRAFIALGAIPHLLWIGEVGPFEGFDDWKGAALRASIVAAAVVAVVGYVSMAVG